MMEILELKVGSILHIMELDENYRVIYRNGNYSVTILMNERDDMVHAILILPQGSQNLLLRIWLRNTVFLQELSFMF